MRELGFKRAFVMHGLDDAGDRGMDDCRRSARPHRRTSKADGGIENPVTPEELGLRRAAYADLASSRDVQREALTLLQVITGADDGPRQDIVCLNAAPLLYVMDRTKDLAAGIAMARAAVQDGRALAKLRAWVTWQNADPEAGLRTLDRMLAQTSHYSGTPASRRPS